MPEILQPPWGGVTDPDNHDPTNFRYLLHLDSGRAVDPNDVSPGAQRDYFLHNPAAIQETGHLSASLVDRQHSVLWQFTPSIHGLILEVPPSGVLATAPRDMFGSHLTPEEIADQFPPMDPDVLLSETPTTWWNEVLVSTEGLVVRAMFWVVDTEDVDQSDAPFDFEAVSEAANSAGLSLVEIELIKY